jgi:tRNA dimethylallyltransferase
MLITMNTITTKQPFALILYGPTGVGKTDVALSIASLMPSEIINMDVGQFYKPLTVGTAKPDWKHEATPHHLFDIIDNTNNYTVVEYRKQVQFLLNGIRSRGNLPIIVGGSAFYLYSLLFPPITQMISLSSEHNCEDSWQQLHAIDPQRAQKIDKKDTYRIARALDIWNKTGTVPTSFVPAYSPFADFILLYIIRDTQDLNKRIYDRVESMLEQGWIEETELLMNTVWHDFIKRKK